MTDSTLRPLAETLFYMLHCDLDDDDPEGEWDSSHIERVCEEVLLHCPELVAKHKSERLSEMSLALREAGLCDSEAQSWLDASYTVRQAKDWFKAGAVVAVEGMDQLSPSRCAIKFQPFGGGVEWGEDGITIAYAVSLGYLSIQQAKRMSFKLPLQRQPNPDGRWMVVDLKEDDPICAIVGRFNSRDQADDQCCKLTKNDLSQSSIYKVQTADQTARQIANNVFDRQLSGGADWVNSTWHIGDRPDEGISPGSLFLCELDDDGGAVLVRRTINSDGDHELFEVAEWGSFYQAVLHCIDRRWTFEYGDLVERQLPMCPPELLRSFGRRENEVSP